MSSFENLVIALGTQFPQNPYKPTHKCYYDLAHFMQVKSRLWVWNALELYPDDWKTVSTHFFLHICGSNCFDP